MDNQLSDLFDFNDEDDAHYYNVIPTIDYKIIQPALMEDIKIINKSSMTMQEWAKFKYGLMQCEEKWNVKIFDWKIDTKNFNPKPYISINIIWDNLENKSSRAYQIHMAFENIWFCENRLTNIWKYIDDGVKSK
jgi:hypothetical protein